MIGFGEFTAMETMVRKRLRQNAAPLFLTTDPSIVDAEKHNKRRGAAQRQTVRPGGRAVGNPCKRAMISCVARGGRRLVDRCFGDPSDDRKQRAFTRLAVWVRQKVRMAQIQRDVGERNQ